MYIRVNDKDDIIKYDSFFNFLNAKRRKGHQIIKFNIKGNDFEYFEDELSIKYIGKHELNLFKQVQVYWLTTNTSSLIFQALDSANLHFLTIDDSTGEITKVKFSDLEEGMDLVLYDPTTKDYVLDELGPVVCLYSFNQEDQVLTPDQKLMKNIYTKEEAKLSRYILSLEQNSGMIINNFMII
ncbi:MAG: hypothetical protein BWY53_00190 [Parcubacteria group bacterium ADurb.Bin326]|nr:MAG: hypothetical protein BWY53_00190 [Parcubacteria group bacterium ADurb.Bin326]